MPSLLIVDDLPAIHELIKSLVGPTGFLCAGATSGEDALERFRHAHFDAVLVDYSMEPMDGLELSRQLLVEDPSAKIVLMSGYADDDLEKQTWEAGAVGLIEKPFQVDRLLETLQMAVDSAASSESIATASDTDSDQFVPLDVFLERQRRRYISLVLEAVGGNHAKAAQILGIDAREIS